MGFLRCSRGRIIVIGAFSVLCLGGSSMGAHPHEPAASGLQGIVSDADGLALPAVGARKHASNTKQVVQDLQKQKAVSREPRQARAIQRERFWLAVLMGVVCANTKAEQ